MRLALLQQDTYQQALRRQCRVEGTWWYHRSRDWPRLAGRPWFCVAAPDRSVAAPDPGVAPSRASQANICPTRRLKLSAPSRRPCHDAPPPLCPAGGTRSLTLLVCVPTASCWQRCGTSPPSSTQQQAYGSAGCAADLARQWLGSVNMGVSCITARGVARGVAIHKMLWVRYTAHVPAKHSKQQ